MRRFLPMLESLEGRVNPAGTVTASFADGTWTLVGDAEDNVIQIKPGSLGEFNVLGMNGTTVVGLTDAAGVHNIVIKLGQGDDSVTVNENGDPALLTGSLKIFGGHGHNTAFINTMQIHKNLAIRNGQGFDDLYVADSVIWGKVLIENGSGGSDTEIYRDEAESSSVIAGNLVIRNGAGKDYVEIVDTHVGGNVAVANGLPDAGGVSGGVYIYNELLTTGRSVIGGNVSVRYAGGEVDENDGIWDTEVLGNVSYNYGGGVGRVHFDGYKVDQPVHIHGNLTMGGVQEGHVLIGRQFWDSGLTVDGNLTIRTGGLNDTIVASWLQVGGATDIRTGGGTDEIIIDNARFAGPASFRTGGGFDKVHFSANNYSEVGVQFLRAFKLLTGGGNDWVRLGHVADTNVVEVFGKAFLDGGAGPADQLDLYHLDPVHSAPVIQGFEVISEPF